MVTLDQQTWNTLFAWMQDGQCMLPEGCSLPPEGVAIYAAALIIVLGFIYIGFEERIDRWLGSLFDFY
ncbi:MAG: hypothetical protein ABEJ36_03665 [Candidatus Nanosalina sp.]